MRIRKQMGEWVHDGGGSGEEQEHTSKVEYEQQPQEAPHATPQTFLPQLPPSYPAEATEQQKGVVEYEAPAPTKPPPLSVRVAEYVEHPGPCVRPRLRTAVVL